MSKKLVYLLSATAVAYTFISFTTTSQWSNIGLAGSVTFLVGVMFLSCLAAGNLKQSTMYLGIGGLISLILMGGVTYEVEEMFMVVNASLNIAALGGLLYIYKEKIGAYVWS